MTTPETLTRALSSPASLRHRLISGGDCVRKQHHALPCPLADWTAVKGEYRRLTEAEYAERHGWNIRLSAHGTLDVFLTPFQKLTGKVPVLLVEQLQKLHGEYPSALVVQRVTRKALQMATGDTSPWRVHPAVVAAVAEAMRAYNAVRAPLRPLNAVQRLGYLDEEDAIVCAVALAGDFCVERQYPLETETIDGMRLEERPRPGQARNLPPAEIVTEDVLVTGPELLIRIRGESGHWHAFTHYPLSREQQSERPEIHFHLLSELITHFHIPEVPDVATLHPEQFAEYQRRLRALETAHER